MLEKFKYTNHINETLDFGENCIFVNENDLRDFAWDIASKNNKISSFKKGIVSKTIPVILKCNTEAEGVALRNRLFETCEKDVLAKQHGRIQIGDYYLRCYITGSKKSDYLIHKNYMVVSLAVQTDFPEWVKETTFNYLSDSNEPSAQDLDYPHDYPHDYYNDFFARQINNTGLVPSNFVITIFGQVTNPIIYIGEHRYAVNVNVDTGEYLTIDSVKKTITLTTVNGEKLNCFNDRDKTSYIFEKIPVGVSFITVQSGLEQFNITLLEERSEPKWT